MFKENLFKIIKFFHAHEQLALLFPRSRGDGLRKIVSFEFPSSKRLVLRESFSVPTFTFVRLPTNVLKKQIMAATNVSEPKKNAERCNAALVGTRSENYMILSSIYALNNSDTKRIHVGLRASNEAGTLKPMVKLTGNSATGIYFDQDTWRQFQTNMEYAAVYLRGAMKKTPDPVLINDVVIHFTSAYGERAIMVTYHQKKEEEEEENIANGSAAPPPAKKRKTYIPSIVMQKTSFDGLEKVLKCVDTRYEQLADVVDLVNVCVQFLIKEIELNIPKGSMDVNAVRRTLFDKYQDIETNVRRQITNLEFLDNYFQILFNELTSIHLNEIVRTAIMNIAS